MPAFEPAIMLSLATARSKSMGRCSDCLQRIRRFDYDNFAVCPLDEIYEKEAPPAQWHGIEFPSNRLSYLQNADDLYEDYINTIAR